MEEKILDVLVSLCEDKIIKENKDIELFSTGLLDSLTFTELLIIIEDDFGISISPTAVERTNLDTPNKIIEYLKKRS